MGRASRERRERREDPARATTKVARPTRRPLQRPLPNVPLWLHFVALNSLAALSIGIYYKGLAGPFVFDDLNAVAQSALVRSVWPLQRFIANSTRPLMDFSYALNYAAGQLDPWWYHATSLFLHVGAVMIVYAIALRTATLPVMAERYGRLRQPFAWAAAAIFAAHPLATETVVYVSSRSEVLVAVFYLLTLYSYVIAISTTSSSLRLAATIGIPLGTVFAFASKEIAVTLPAALVLYDIVFVSSGDLPATLSRWRRLALPLIPVALAALYLLTVSTETFAPYSQSAGFGFDRYTRGEYLATQFGVLVHYLRLVVLPAGLNFDYDWPLAQSFSTPNVLASMGALMTLFGLAVYSLHKQPLFSFAILWTFLVLAPTSSIMPLADLAVERRMYIPLFGFALLGAGAGLDLSAWIARLHTGLTRLGRTALFALIMIAPVGAFAAMTAARAALWGDDLALHLDGVSKSPASPRMHLNLGVIYLNTGDSDNAHKELAEAKRLYDLGESIHAFERIGAFIHYNLGAILYTKKDFDQAEIELERALQIGGHYLALRPMAYLIRGHIARGRGDWAAAESHFSEALKYNQGIPDLYLVLIEAQLMGGNWRDASATMRRLNHRYPEEMNSEFGQSLVERYNTTRKKEQRAKVRRALAAKKAARAAEDK